MKIKQGATLSLIGVRVDADGQTVDITATDILCQLRANNFVADLIIVKTAPAEGRFRAYATAEDTINWPLVTLKGDIMYRDIDFVDIDDTFDIEVIEAQTRV
jgi:hypothetical protein